MNEALRKAREILADVTPLKKDCGRVCGGRCCAPLEGEDTGMLLFPGEEEGYQNREGWTIRETPMGKLAVCPGHCNREDRPLACRLFPLLPVLSDSCPGRIRVKVDQRSYAVCPLAGQGKTAMLPAFTEAVRQAGEELLKDGEQKDFLLRLSREQEEWECLRKRWRDGNV